MERDWAVIGMEVTPVYYYISVCLIVGLLAWLEKTTILCYFALAVAVAEIDYKMNGEGFICLIIAIVIGSIMAYSKKKYLIFTICGLFILFLGVLHFRLFMLWDFTDQLYMFYHNVILAAIK